jgi:chaperonin GroES
MKSQIKPLGERVLIRRSVAQSKTKSGLFIPDNAKEKPLEGEVLSVGDKVTELKAGDVVLFGKYTGNEVEIDSEEYVLVKAEDVIGVIEREAQ